MKQKKIREHAEALLKKDPDDGMKYLQDQVDKGLPVDYAERIVKEKDMSKLQRGFNSLSVKAGLKDTAIEAYKLANIKEKASLFKMLENKVNNKDEQIPQERTDELNKFLDDAYQEIVDALAAKKLNFEDVYQEGQ